MNKVKKVNLKQLSTKQVYRELEKKKLRLAKMTKKRDYLLRRVKLLDSKIESLSGKKA